MGKEVKYKALITIDLPGSDDEVRKEFYKVLEDEHWTKIHGLTTAWKVTFKEGSTRDKVIIALEKHLKKAKKESKAKKVDYAIQVDPEDVVINTLSK